MNCYEKEIKSILLDMGYEVLEKGWPDFLAFKNDRMIFVECKSEKDRPLKHQERLLNVLCAFGMEVYIIREPKKHDPPSWLMKMDRFKKEGSWKDLE